MHHRRQLNFRVLLWTLTCDPLKFQNGPRCMCIGTCLLCLVKTRWKFCPSGSPCSLCSLCYSLCLGHWTYMSSRSLQQGFGICFHPTGCKPTKPVQLSLGIPLGHVFFQSHSLTHSLFRRHDFHLDCSRHIPCRFLGSHHTTPRRGHQ